MAGKNFGKEAIGASIDIVTDDHMVAAVERQQHCTFGGQTRSKRQGIGRIFQRSQCRL